MAARLVDDPTDFVLGMAMPLDQLAIALRFLERVQVLALDILDQRDLGRGRFVNLADDCGDRVQPRALRRAPTALAGDDHIIPTLGPEQDRLEDAALADRVGELVERFLVELDARLVRVGPDPRDLNLAHTAARGGRFARAGSRRRP